MFSGLTTNSGSVVDIYFIALTISLLIIVIAKNLMNIFNNWKYLILIVPLIVLYISQKQVTLLVCSFSLDSCLIIKQFNSIWFIFIFIYSLSELLLPVSLTGWLILKLDILIARIRHICEYLIHFLCKNSNRHNRKNSTDRDIIFDDRSISDEKDDQLGFVDKNGSTGLVNEFYEICINKRFVAEKNTIIILDSLYRIGKSSFLNLLHNKIKIFNNTWAGVKSGKIKEIKFSATTLLADCDKDNDISILYKFLDAIKQELRGTANYELFKFIIKGYFKSKFGFEFANLGNNNFQGLLKSVKKHHQKIILIIEDLDRVKDNELQHVIKFLWHIKDLPYMVTILPAQAHILCFNLDIDNINHQNDQNQNRDNTDNEKILPSYSQTYHKLIDDVYHLTDKVRHMQVKWLWGINNQLYDKSDDEILIKVHTGNKVKKLGAFANSDYVNQNILYIDDECLKFNGQEIVINNLSTNDIAKIVKIKGNNTVKYNELLFLPLRMINFWQNTTIYQNWRHEQLFYSIIFNILSRFQVNTSEIKKAIKIFKNHYQQFKSKNIFDVLIYLLIEIRYEFYLQDILSTPDYENSFLKFLRNAILDIDYISRALDFNYKSLPIEIINLLEYTSSYSKVFTIGNRGIERSTGLFNYSDLNKALKWSNNQNNEENISYSLIRNDARGFMDYLAHNIHPFYPNKCQYLLFMFYHSWLVLDNGFSALGENICINTLYKLTSLRFFDETPNYEYEMTDMEIGYCFSNFNAIFFAILYIATYDELIRLEQHYLKNYKIWMTKNIRKLFNMIHLLEHNPPSIPYPKHHSLYQVWMELHLNKIFIIKDCNIDGIIYKECCLFMDIINIRNDGVWGTIYPQFNQYIIYMKVGIDKHYEDLKITVQQFINNINKVYELN